MGSPLRRFFAAFIGSAYVHPHIYAKLLSEKFDLFQWINVYRPWDPIGTRLVNTKYSTITEICTHQWLKIVHAHLGYWSDPKVTSMIYEALVQNDLHAGDTIRDIDNSVNSSAVRRGVSCIWPEMPLRPLPDWISYLAKKYIREGVVFIIVCLPIAFLLQVFWKPYEESLYIRRVM